MRWFFALYLQCIKNSVSTSIAYRANFLFVVVMSFFSNMLLPIVTILIYQNGAEIPGWTFYEALLIQAVFMLCTGLCSPLFYNLVNDIMYKVREGLLDVLMIKPGSALLISIAYSFQLEAIGGFFGGLWIFAYALSNLPAPSFIDWLGFLFLFVMGMAVSLGLVLIMAATAFKWVGMSRMFEIYDAVTTFGRYPMTIFNRTFATVFSFCVPVGMLGFFPASSILHRSDSGMFLAAIPCVLFMLFGVFLFKKMISAYQSAGG